MQLHIEDMTCAACARSVTQAILAVDANAQVKADPPNRLVEVESRATVQQIMQAVREVGFTPDVAQGKV